MKRHLKRLRVPKFWKIPKKVYKWAPKPSPGPHKAFESIPLVIIVRDILGIADTSKEAKSIIKMGNILVDGKARKDIKYPVGLMDVITVPELKMRYRIFPTNHGLELVEIDADESKKKIYKVENKVYVKNKKIQLNLHDNTNILLDEKDGNKYKTGDSVLMDLDKKEIEKHLKLKKGNMIVITRGKNIGVWGKIDDVVITKTKEPTKVICDVDGEMLEVIKDYIFVIGEKESAINV